MITRKSPSVYAILKEANNSKYISPEMIWSDSWIKTRAKLYKEKMLNRKKENKSYNKNQHKSSSIKNVKYLYFITPKGRKYLTT
jgi:hypothetical protein